MRAYGPWRGTDTARLGSLRIPKNLSDLNIDDAKNPKKGNKDFERSYLCIRSDDFDFQKMRTEYKGYCLIKASWLTRPLSRTTQTKIGPRMRSRIRKRIRNIKEKKKSLITWKNHVTGLLWQRKDNPVIKTFPQAVGYCAGMLYDSKRGWRLLSPKEWQDASKIKEFRENVY